jgi:peptidoglycan/LPS O-acetylase OafA/YrhL
MPDSPSSTPRFAVSGIDKWSILAGVRFLLASVVAVNHLGGYVPLGVMGFIPGFGPFEAILGFLLISGYSISVSYAKQPEGFLIRRMKRLYPVYLAAMAVTCVALLVTHEAQPQWWSLVLNALFLNQLFTTTSFVGPAWSLSLEFWLYCLAPALLRMSSPRTRALVFGSFACYVIYTPLRSLWHLPYYSGVGFGGNLALLSFAWIAGLRLAQAGASSASAMKDVRLLFVGHIVLGAAIQCMYRMKHHALAAFIRNDLLDYAMQALTLVFVWLVFARFVVAPRVSARRSWVLRFLGDVSYPLYLLHVPIYALLQKAGLKMPILYYLAAVGISALVYQALDFYSKERHQKIGTT